MLVGAMKKLAPLLALLVAGCSGADTVDNAASFTTNNAVGAADEQAPNAETSGARLFRKDRKLHQIQHHATPLSAIPSVSKLKLPGSATI